MSHTGLAQPALLLNRYQQFFGQHLPEKKALPEKWLGILLSHFRLRYFNRSSQI
jgi:hypothetical protein